MEFPYLRQFEISLAPHFSAVARLAPIVANRFNGFIIDRARSHLAEARLLMRWSNFKLPQYQNLALPELPFSFPGKRVIFSREFPH
jgi:hypothetical protein